LGTIVVPRQKTTFNTAQKTSHMSEKTNEQNGTFDCTSIIVIFASYFQTQINSQRQKCSRDGSVSIVIGYRLHGRGSFLDRRKDNFLFCSVQLPIQYVSEALFQRVKRPGRESDHLSPSSAEVKNGEAIPPLPHTFPLLDV
jgi:hypothetical protein